MIEVFGFEATLKICPRIHAWCGVALEVHVVTGLAVVFAAKEMIEANFLQRRR